MASLHFDSDFRFDLDDSFTIYSHALTCPSTAGTSFSSASSGCEPYTPTSRRSTPNELTLDFDASFGQHNHNHNHNHHSHHHSGDELTTPPSTMSKFLFKSEQDHAALGFTPVVLPSTPVRTCKLDNMSSRSGSTTHDYEALLGLNMAPRQHQHHQHHHHQQHQHHQQQHQHHHHSGPMTPTTNSFSMYTISPQASTMPGTAYPFIMTPTHSLSGGSDMAESTSSSTWSCANDSPLALFPPQQKMLSGSGSELESGAAPGRFFLQGAPPPSPSQLRAHRKLMVHELQRKTSELQRAQQQEQFMRASVSVSTRKLSAGVEAGTGAGTGAGAGGVDVVRRAMCKCDYPGCHKAFRRNEHLKRHKQTFHGEGPNRFSCEFCGKDQFNRQDNLNNHRKLHARPNSRNRGVEFIPAAVPIIELEERSRKRRAPPKSKMMKHEEY